ncbi:plexin-B1 isoform X5 [Takifugu flavidus]|uniref:plexin-B1 isoform X5 n=1 Tax=Takifugu flavidus TaxID=433684 RepID=UPI0025440E7A|nr:plexin-B1 isoform X5 [Takifugu flavidus]
MVRHLFVLALKMLLSILLLAISFSVSVVRGSSPLSLYPTFVQNNTQFEHLALHPDPSIGWIYVGAQDHLFQLDRFLQPEYQTDTGPIIDSRECLPPVTESNCPQARITNNHNKLLLVDPYSMELITCGSVNQGICQKRSLDSVNNVFFSTERPVDTQYVAANHPNVSTVGLVVRPKPDRKPLMFVGRGYTSSHPPISTRNLAQEPVFSYEETAKLAVAGRLSEYDHHFVSSFAHRQHVYFFFYRRDLKSMSREYRTYVSRICLDDQAYYSYVEVPLTCRSMAGKVYNLLQAAQLGISKDGVVDSETLFGVFSTHSTSSFPPSEDSALCMFNLEDVDRRIISTRDLCYTQMGREAGVEVAYIEYEVKSNCANLPEPFPFISSVLDIRMGRRGGTLALRHHAVNQLPVQVPEEDSHSTFMDALVQKDLPNTLETYPCGSDHTPSPMASRVPVEAETILNSPSARLTAVAVSVRAAHTIAFLGDSRGNLHKVFLGPNGEVEEYSVISVQKNAAISSDLILDQNEEHLFIMTPNMLQKRPVAECQQHPDCQSCLLAHDPYCGWCVLDGRCVLQSQCSRGQRPGEWLWSFDMDQQCLQVQELNPSNLSREESQTVSLTVPGLPLLDEGESYSCIFEDVHSPAVVSRDRVSCQSPNPGSLPVVPLGQDYITVSLSLRFGSVTITVRDFTFYDCTAVKQLSGRTPCRGCVRSRWGCNWCVQQHVCTHKPTCEDGAIIYNQHGDEGSYVSWGSSACPCLEKVQGSSLLPVGVERKITLLAQNLHLYQDVELDYECVLVIEGHTVVVDAFVESDDMNPSSFDITCQLHKYQYSSVGNQYNAMVYVKRRNTFHLDSSPDLFVTLYNCSVGRSDCSRCHTADQKYGCVWCGGAQASCLYSQSCSEPVQHTCPAPVIHSIEPLSGLLEGGTMVTISGSNLGQKVEDILHSVSVAGVPCSVISSLYEISSRIVCRTAASGGKNSGQVSVKVSGGELGLSTEMFTFQDPFVMSVSPHRGPKAGGTILTIIGRNLLTGRPSDLTVTVGRVSCHIMEPYSSSSLQCVTGSSNLTGQYRVTLHYSSGLRHLHSSTYRYTHNPNITLAMPTKSFLRGGRLIYVSGHNLDVVQEPRMVVTSSSFQLMQQRGKRMLPDHPECPENLQCFVREFSERCDVNSSSLMLCRSPSVDSSVMGSKMTVEFLLDNLRFNLSSLTPQGFTYEPNPDLRPLNQQDPMKAYRYNPGSFIQLEGENLDLAITKDEVVVLIGQGVCAVKTLTRNHLYCEPPPKQPPPISNGRKREGFDSLPEFTVQMGNLNFSLGKVQYDTIGLSTFPLEAQIGVGVGASIVALIVLIIVLIYRRKSKQAMKDYKKVQIQLENLETSVRDRCKKEFTDLMTEMMDMSSDLVGSGIPFLDYRMYAERIFFPGHRESPLRRDLDVQECRRQTVEQGLVQLSNLLNSKLFLTKFIHTLESQRTFSPRDRAYVASLLTVALHGKLEYFTDILKTLLNDLVEQYVAKNPKLMLRRTETVVEKLLTNWMSICLYAFLRDSAGESLYMLFRAIKHQVDKGPVDAVTGKAKYTLNDNRLLREDVEYRTLTLNVLVQGAGVSEYQPLPTKVLDCDTITQVKEKLLDQVYKGTSFSHRPHSDLLDLEWRSGVAGHLILSDEDLTSVVQGSWKRLNTLQHYKVPEGATVALVARHTKHIHHDNHDYMAGEKTPMLEDADEGGVRPWHLVKASEEPELPKHRRGSLRERERAKAIPEIYLTRLLSMKGTLQKFVDDLFTVILSTCRPVPLAVKYFFDLLDEQAGQHGISDSDTIHIWKTNSLPLRFWINIIKNPQFIFDVQASDHVDAVLSVISQTFMDSCTIAEHKLGRDSPINKLLYARDIPRYKQMVERYYSDIRQTVSASDQEMNSALAELSRVSTRDESIKYYINIKMLTNATLMFQNYSGELNYLVALHELYKYINKYYDQIITALEEDSTAQKMQLGYRLQQIAAAVENKVTDL